MERDAFQRFDKTNGQVDKYMTYSHISRKSMGKADDVTKEPHAQPVPKSSGLVELGVCVAGIYLSFITWGILQERLTTTRHGPPAAPETWTYSIFLNTIQSGLAAISGYIYLLVSSRGTPKTPAIFPSRAIFGPLSLVAITSSLASPFGYESLKHIDYITFILAKSCKLLPVMALHLTVFRKRYPISKYAIVTMITLGVAMFTVNSSSSSKKASKHNAKLTGKNGWGLFLLAINLLFDGLTNSTQDHIFQTFRPYSGPQMMCAQNIMSTVLTGTYLLLGPYLAQTGIGSLVGMEIKGSELGDAISFIQRYPQAGYDVLGFALCGAIGQVFIFYTLARFSSLLLVTITVTRKMLSMIFSVVWFGHRIEGMQWLGVGLVFGGVGLEGVIQRREKAAKEKAKLEAAKKESKKAQ